ncbi:Amino acid/polyamine transporter I [Macrophomina phaseolina MS6]|uniref:Amino acid/polyamine transporter I n=2 Tax=Macrophomina phaseolina TaxID=35725 RepID=K2S0C4_MACPH|nr:Amino acid/polyamine transporter I [Macrophomina phaseolina MS6]KAH7042028.1 AAT family amino acid transporter [Macrophomina phaseolina]
MAEKDLYSVGVGGHESPTHDARDIKDIVNSKGNAVGEAADIYGDVQTAEELGYVHRGLKSRHIQFIALGGTIGTGLFLGIGKAFATSGPLSVLLGYSFTGLAVWGMMNCLGEMTTWLPLPGAIPQYCARYVDPALGFAVGWNSWYQSAITLCAEISAAAVVVGYWNDEISQAAWISIIIVLVLCLNIFAVAIYGEAEFIFASIKIITIVGLIIMAVCLDLGGGNQQGRLGFRYWKNPGAMNEYIASGSEGRFLGLFATLVNAAFSYGGVEMVAVAAGEADDPRRNIPKAVRRVFWRILFFYVLGSLAIGVLVPSNDEHLLNGAATAARSPWVIAINRAGVPVLPHIINAVILTSASSSANAFLFTGSRYLFGIAQNNQAPKFLLKCSRTGVPYYCVGVTAAVSLLTYMSVSSGAGVVFEWMMNIVTIAQLFTWCSVLVAYIRFRQACHAQGVTDDQLPMRSRFQPYVAYITLGFFAIIILFNGFSVFTNGNWSIDDFITAYIGIPIFFGLYLFWKVLKREPIVKVAEADIWSGKAALDAQIWPERVPRNFAERVWFWIA